MTTTSNCSLRSNRSKRFLVLAAGLSLFCASPNPFASEIKPIGQISDLLKDGNPWRGFEDDGPVLLVMRIERLAASSCAPWTQALTAERAGRHIVESPGPNAASPGLSAPAPEALAAGWKAWQPFEEKDLENMKDCTRYPCDLKFDRHEVERLAAVPEAQRPNEFLILVGERATRYVETQKRGEYEFPGDPVDPWKVFDEAGLKSPLQRPLAGTLWIRSQAFPDHRIRPICQVLDLRSAVSTTGTEATVWVRDAYTSHYFDGWGEYAHVSCNSGTATVELGLMVEFDLLKKSDLFSLISRGRLRNAVHETGSWYLDQWFGEMKNLVYKGR